MTIDHASDGTPAAGGASSDAELHRRISELEESERLFRDFVEETDDIITRTDADGALLYLNPAAARSIELTAAACAGRRLFDFLHPEDRGRVEAELSDGIARQSTSVTLESRLVGGSGQILELLWRFNLRYDGGRLAAINAIARDISDRKRIEQSLREREAGLAEAQRLAHLGNWDLDVRTQALSWTDEVYRIFGLTPLEFKANRDAFFERVHPDDAAYVARENEAALANERPYSVEHRIIRPNGEVRHVYQKAEVTFDESGAPVRFFGTVQDITEKYEAERQREALQEQMIEAQRATIRALATPLIPLAEGLIAMPLVGTIDRARAQQILETLLRGISTQRARTAIMDITGVKLVDAAVADGLLQAARAARLLGAEVILTGVSPEVARVLVELSIDMGGLTTCSTLERGIARARRPR
jgi:rsbT co-antagonist protein RsbR